MGGASSHSIQVAELSHPSNGDNLRRLFLLGLDIQVFVRDVLWPTKMWMMLF